MTQRPVDYSRDRLSHVLLGALLVGSLVTAGRGLVWGWHDYHQQWGWVSLLFGMLMGPIFLVTDLMSLLQFDVSDILILPWSASGALLGGLLGYLLPRRRPAGDAS